MPESDAHPILSQVREIVEGGAEKTRRAMLGEVRYMREDKTVSNLVGAELRRNAHAKFYFPHDREAQISIDVTQTGIQLSIPDRPLVRQELGVLFQIVETIWGFQVGRDIEAVT